MSSRHKHATNTRSVPGFPSEDLDGVEGVFILFDYDIKDLIWDKNFFYDCDAFEPFCDFWFSFYRRTDFIHSDTSHKWIGASEFSIDLHRYHDFIIDCEGFDIFRPWCEINGTSPQYPRPLPLSCQERG